MQLDVLLRQIPEVAERGGPDVRIEGISFDSRRVQGGHLFVAVRGGKLDGRSFVQEAIRRGAVAIASEGPVESLPGVATIRVPDARAFLARAARILFGNPAGHMKLVGITGTNGKTTTSYLVDSIFRVAGMRSCVIGTLGARIGDRALPGGHTTPESVDLFRLLREALDAGCTSGAVEVSSHALSLKRVFGAKFSVGVFMNLTPEHLDFHGDMESYYRAKRLLFTPEGENGIEGAVVNIDDQYGRRLAGETGVPVLRFGVSPEADIRMLEHRGDLGGTAMRMQTPSGALAVRLPLPGRPNLYNAMAAAGAALFAGLGTDPVRGGLETADRVPGRMESVDAGQSFEIIVDYAHTPDALERLLQTVRDACAGRVLTVFGCGGDRDRSKRPRMGEIAARLSDAVFATSDNPRNEDPGAILREIEPGLALGRAPHRMLPDRREAIRAALAEAREGDVVVIAGKGHEDCQIVGNRVLPFDDRTVARELVAELAGMRQAGDRRELHR